MTTTRHLEKLVNTYLDCKRVVAAHAVQRRLDVHVAEEWIRDVSSITLLDLNSSIPVDTISVRLRDQLVRDLGYRKQIRAVVRLGFGLDLAQLVTRPRTTSEIMQCNLRATAHGVEARGLQQKTPTSESMRTTCFEMNISEQLCDQEDFASVRYYEIAEWYRAAETGDVQANTRHVDELVCRQQNGS
jgi:hypothetical protein